MRPPPDMPARPPRVRRRSAAAEGRGRVLLILAVVLLFVLATSLRGIASFYTDYLWFSSLHLSQVWRGVLGAKFALAVIFTGTFFVIAWVNLLVADRIAPPFRMTAGSEEDLVERYHELVGSRAGLVRSGVAVVLALLVGTGVSSQWKAWILFTHRVNFGQKDATFHTDIAFYVFQLPFLRFLVGWFFSALMIVLIASLVAHYLNGGIRMQVPGDRVSPQVKAHISVLLGLLLLVKAVGYWLQRYDLVFSTRGTVDGATYTDVHVQLVAIYLLMAICVFAVGLFLANIRRRGWILPLIAVGLWAFSAVLAGQVMPGLVQRFKVQPDEPAKEAPYIVHNIAATRQALGLAKVQRKPFAADGNLTGADLQKNADVVRNIRLWDPNVAVTALQRSQGQGLRDFYDISDVDVDRYVIDGKVTQVNVAARELESSRIPQKTWVAQHLTYTHGYGAVLSPANATTKGGQPALDVKDVPLVSRAGAPTVSQPRVYIGEGQRGYVIVKTKQNEYDFQGAGRTSTTVYSGKDGVALNSFLRRAAFALRFGQIDPLISSNVKNSSRILMQRDISDRLHAVAPFLQWDSDPYPVLTDGGVQWVLDGYTTSTNYPNAQRADVGDVNPGADLRSSFNYVRNSIKATVDAYDGTVKLYIVDKSDPLIRAYQKAFPSLFTDGSKVPKDIRAHFRYPEDLFRVQTTMWGRYHMDDPGAFYSRTDEWNVAPDPELSFGSDATVTTDTTPTTGATSSNVSNQRGGDRVDPYYLQLRLPGETTESFTLLRPFVAGSKNNQTRALTAFLSAKSDPNDYGKLESFSMPASRLPAGPQDIVQAINADSAVSSDITLFCQKQAACTSTSLLVIPIEQTLLYVRPLYVEAEAGTDKSPPQLERVIVAYQTGGTIEVKIAPTLAEALTDLFGSSPTTLETPPTGTGTGTGTGTVPTATEKTLILQIGKAFDAANAALKKGDLGEYAAQIQQAQKLFKQLQDLQNGTTTTGSGSTGTGTGTGSTTTTAPRSSSSTTVVGSGTGSTTSVPSASTTSAPRGSTTSTTKPSA